jgi:hypothetical protein
MVNNTATLLHHATDAVQRGLQRVGATDASIVTDRRCLATVKRGPVATLLRQSIRRIRCLADGRVCRVEPRCAQLPQATDARIVILGASVVRTPPRLSRVPVRCNSGEPTDARVTSVAPRASVCCSYFDGLAMFARSTCFTRSLMSYSPYVYH